MSGALDITAIILSFNEEIHIARCIDRIRPHVRRIVVVDSFSTDRTVEIAQERGAEILQNPFENQSQQFNWALDTLAIDTAWTLRLDCDEYLDDRAVSWMASNLERLSDRVTAIEFHLRMIFKGTPITHGGYDSTDLVRLWRTGSSKIEDRWMDERVITTGQTVRSDGLLIDENLNSIGWWTDKHNRYATRHVVDLLMLEHSPLHKDRTSGHDLARRVRFKRFLRNRVYFKVPLFLRPLLYWSYRYFIRLGFLDGKHGLVWHFLHGLWYYMLIDLKLYEARIYIREYGLKAYERQLAQVHNIDISLSGEERARELAS